MSIKIGQLSEAISRDLTIYSNEVTEGIKKATKNSMGKLVSETKKTAPVGRRKEHYRDNITSRKLEETDRGITYQWYVKGADNRLSHLLENGHATRDGGRTRGTHFIHNAEEAVVEEYLKKIEEVVRNGG